MFRQAENSFQMTTQGSACRLLTEFLAIKAGYKSNLLTQQNKKLNLRHRKLRRFLVHLEQRGVCKTSSKTYTLCTVMSHDRNTMSPGEAPSQGPTVTPYPFVYHFDGKATPFT